MAARYSPISPTTAFETFGIIQNPHGPFTQIQQQTTPVHQTVVTGQPVQYTTSLTPFSTFNPTPVADTNPAAVTTVSTIPPVSTTPAAPVSTTPVSTNHVQIVADELNTHLQEQQTWIDGGNPIQSTDLSNVNLEEVILSSTELVMKETVKKALEMCETNDEIQKLEMEWSKTNYLLKESCNAVNKFQKRKNDLSEMIKIQKKKYSELRMAVNLGNF